MIYRSSNLCSVLSWFARRDHTNATAMMFDPQDGTCAQGSVSSVAPPAAMTNAAGADLVPMELDADVVIPKGRLCR